MGEPGPSAELCERPSRREERSHERGLRSLALSGIDRRGRGRPGRRVGGSTTAGGLRVSSSSVARRVARCAAHDDRVAFARRMAEPFDHREREHGIGAPGGRCQLPLVGAAREPWVLVNARSASTNGAAAAEDRRRASRPSSPSSNIRVSSALACTVRPRSHNARAGSADSTVPKPAVKRFSRPGSPMLATLRSSRDREMPAAALVARR